MSSVNTNNAPPAITPFIYDTKAFADANNGNNITAEVGNFFLPFKTIRAAQIAVGANGIVDALGIFNENELLNVRIRLIGNSKIVYNQDTTLSPNPFNEVFPNGIRVEGNGELIITYSGAVPVNWAIRTISSITNVFKGDRFEITNKRNIAMDANSRWDIEARELKFGNYSYVFANNIGSGANLNIIKCATLDTNNTHATFNGNGATFFVNIDKVTCNNTSEAFISGQNGQKGHFEIGEVTHNGNTSFVDASDMLEGYFELNKYRGNRKFIGEIRKTNLDVRCSDCITDDQCFNFSLDATGGAKVTAKGRFKSTTTPCVTIRGSSGSKRKMSIEGEIIAATNEVVESKQGNPLALLPAELIISGKITNEFNNANGHGITFENNPFFLNKIQLDPKTHISLAHPLAKLLSGVEGQGKEVIVKQGVTGSNNTIIGVTELENAIQKSSKFI